MSRIVLLVLVAILIVVVWRPARETVQPHVQFAFDPVYEWSTRNKVKELTGDLRQQVILGRTLPRPAEYAAFVEGSRGDGSSNDPWGTPYYLLLERRTFQVGSAGPDRQPGTPDDILGEPGEHRQDLRRRR